MSKALKYKLLKFSLWAIVLVAICLLLTACGAPPPAEQEQMGPKQFIFNTVWFILIGILVYYMMVLKPGFDKEDAHRKFIDELKKNDEVVTSGGIFGRVHQVKPEFISVEIASNVRIKVKPQHVMKPKSASSGDASKDESQEKKGKDKK